MYALLSFPQANFLATSLSGNMLWKRLLIPSDDRKDKCDVTTFITLKISAEVDPCACTNEDTDLANVPTSEGADDSTKDGLAATAISA
jgi:hypothetical protein